MASLPTTPNGGWTLSSLTELFAADPEALGDVDVAIAGDGEVLRLTLKERGDLDVLIAASGEQILASVVLVAADDVPQRAAFERFVLATHKLVPLSTFGITAIDGKDWFELFGAVSAHSKAAVVVEEVAVLAANAAEAAEMIGEWMASGGEAFLTGVQA